MPNIAAVLKAEIVRLARKEVRRQTEKLRRGTVQHRKSIAAMQREIQDLRRQVTLATAQAHRAPTAHATERSSARVRFTAGGLRSLRKRLGLTAEAFGRLAGVSSQTVYNWEHGNTRPAETQLTALAQARAMGKREARLRLKGMEAPVRRKHRKA